MNIVLIGHGMVGHKLLECLAAQESGAARRVTLSTGKSLDYDKLVLATGSTPFVPSIDGRNCRDSL